MRSALLAALLVAFGTVAGAQQYEKSLETQDPAKLREAFVEIRRDAGKVDPAVLLIMAARLGALGEHDEALFWFLAGQLRMRYVLSVAPDSTRGQVLGAMVASLGMQIYPAFNMQEDRIAATIDRVLAWDRVTPVDFSWL